MSIRENITFFGETNFRNQKHRFGIKTDDRRRHMYVIGKTGMGKTTLLENMVYSDIMNGHGLCYIDPHGDTAEKIIDFIPAHRINDVVYFNPSDMEFPFAFNVLESVDEELKHLVASGLLGVFKKIWADSWGPRLEYILRNCLLALLDYPDSTLLGVPRMLADKSFRKKVIRQIKDPVVKAFWEKEFSKWNDRQLTEAIAPIQNKVGQFLSTALIRNIVGQVKSTMNIRRIMDDKKILVLNLSKGRIGEDASALLGAMMITKIQLAAMSRVDTPEDQRPDFYLYVDEFQNFATDSFANILSEARKYHLNLIVAHQYIQQLNENVAGAVFGNVGTLVSFRVGAADAETLVKEFEPVFSEEDIVNLPKFHVYLKLMIDGIASSPFSARALPPLAKKEGNGEKIIMVSRERYAKSREIVEDKIMKWSNNNTPDRPQTSAPIPANTYENVKKEVANLDFTRKKNGGGKGKAAQPATVKSQAPTQSESKKQKLPEDPRDLAKMSPAKLEQMMQAEVAEEPRKKGALETKKTEAGFMSLAELKKKLEGGDEATSTNKTTDKKVTSRPKESRQQEVTQSGKGISEVQEEQPAQKPRIDVSNMSFAPRKKHKEKKEAQRKEHSSKGSRTNHVRQKEAPKQAQKSYAYVPGRNDSAQVHRRTEYIEYEESQQQSGHPDGQVEDSTAVQPNTKVTLS